MTQGSPLPTSAPELKAAVQAALDEIRNGDGTPAPNGYSVRRAPDVIDLDAELAAVDVAPQPITLQGHTYFVRRDLTGVEYQAFMKAVNDGDDLAGFTLLVGADDAERLNTAMETMPRAQMLRVMQRLAAIAGILNAAGGQGEASAS